MMKILIFLFFIAILSLTAYSAPLAAPAGRDFLPDVETLLNKYGCAACHSLQRRLVGPSWTDIAAKKYSKKQIMALVYKPEPANWPGYPPMLAQPTVPKADLKTIADWLTSIQ